MSLCQTISATECVLDSIGLVVLAPFAAGFLVAVLGWLWLQFTDITGIQYANWYVYAGLHFREWLQKFTRRREG